MDILVRQGSKTGIVKIAGTIIGIISLLLIYPLNHEAYGRYHFIFSAALLFSPFLGIGLPNIIIKFFSVFEKRRKDVKSFLPTILVVAICSFLFYILFFIIIGDSFLSIFKKLDFNTTLLKKEKWWVIIIAFLITIVGILRGYISNYGRIVIPTIIYEMSQKIMAPLIILLVAYGAITTNHIAIFIVLFFFIVITGLFIYMRKLNIWKWKTDFGFFKNKSSKKQVLSFGLFSSMSGLGSMLAFRLDSIMITTLLGAVKNGLYFNTLIIATVIDLPFQSISKIASPMIAKSWENKELDTLESIYKKTSILCQIIASLIFLGIWANLNHLFNLSGNPGIFEGATSLFIILGSAKLIDAIMGVNSQIIVFSKFYKFNLYFLILLGILSAITNYLWIPTYGIMGAAYATFLSLTIFNIVKFFFIKVSLGIQPLSMDTIWVMFIFLFTGLVVSYVPDLQSDILMILIKSTLISFIFISLIYKSNASNDFNELVDKYLLTHISKFIK